MNQRFHTNLLAPAVAAAVIGTTAVAASIGDPNDPGIIEPVLTAFTGVETRIANTDQTDGDEQMNLIGDVNSVSADGAASLTGHTITQVTSPNDDMREALKRLERASRDEDIQAMQTEAEELMAILTGTTEGRIYDGFAMLNYNRGAFAPGQVPGEYKMKVLHDTGETEPGPDGSPQRIWEVDISMLWYDGNFDSDTFLLQVPVEADEFDTIRVNYRIYSLVREEFSPTAVMADKRLPGSVQFPFKGLDSVWVPIKSGTVNDLTVALPPQRLLRGVYTWGWRVHPPRIQFLQPVYEHINAHTGEVELEPQGLSYATRNRELTIDGIGEAAPEKKMYRVAEAVLNGTSPAAVEEMLNDDATAPRGRWEEWADLAKDQRQLPPEARDILAAEGIAEGKFGPYRMVTVYMNNEMYGDGPNGSRIEGWNQGDRFQVKLINLDNKTHYFRNVDFGPRLHDDIRQTGNAGSHSFEIMNFKPSYGAPKVAESQWRAGWGFRPHFDVIQQQDTFSRPTDQMKLKPYTDGTGATRLGFQYSAEARGGDFRFNPPPFVIGSADHPSADLLRDEDGAPGIVLGQTTEGYGNAKMCDPATNPGSFCNEDISAYNPNGALNFPPPPLQGVNGLPDHPTELRFPPFLRNPNPAANAGDIIPPTPAWKPFLWLNPHNGTLYNDPNDPSKGYWADLTYAHGAPIPAGESMTATIEAPRASAQVFYQFDDLYHDNAIFSPHPTFSAGGDAID